MRSPGTADRRVDCVAGVVGRPGPAAARWAVASAALSPVATIGGWLVAEALQPPSYSPLRSTISGLAGLGATDRWIMTIALLMVGACHFATAACLPAVRCRPGSC